jgi:hypothetical protein
MNAIGARKELIELTLKAAVIYDDFDYAARTATLLERAAVHAGEAMQWDVKPWRLDLLKPSSLAAAALDETVDADLIVVALCQTHRLSDELMEWLEQWAAHRQIGDAAMMGLCPEETAGSRSSWNRLKTFAEWQGLLFLGHHNVPNDAESADIAHQLWQRKQPVGPALRWPLDSKRAPRHWGINE